MYWCLCFIVFYSSTRVSIEVQGFYSSTSVEVTVYIYTTNYLVNIKVPICIVRWVVVSYWRMSFLALEKWISWEFNLRTDKIDKNLRKFNFANGDIGNWNISQKGQKCAVTKTWTDQNRPGNDQKRPGTDQNRPGTDQEPTRNDQEPSKELPCDRLPWVSNVYVVLHNAFLWAWLKTKINKPRSQGLKKEKPVQSQ